ncbi:hypothetical protein [Micromonospora purpureochromogenes]|uniref:MYXO-CTERM domain-containing protein n=1 Tax=Micromonospora purpureochromogenes TaxID=47872 RepID=A0ABX2RN35_9ACTN|nr:hypothetical protein [Micromonospora purpureochromogenes]NYF57950.1 hypothetical protein [Micromonospora purpureochromogenes]
MSDGLTTFGWVLLGIAVILLLLAIVAAFEGSGDGFGDALMWAFFLALGGVALLCCGGHLGILEG